MDILQELKGERISQAAGADETGPFRALWRGVILQALLDIERKGESLAKNQATSWLFSHAEDFVTVCGLADVDPSYIRRIARKGVRKKNRYWKSSHRRV